MNDNEPLIKDSASRTLETLREGLALISNGSKRVSVLSRLSSDVDNLWNSLRTFWDSVGDADDFDSGAELSSMTTGSRFYGLSSERILEYNSNEKPNDSNDSSMLTNTESAAHAGSTLAASIGTSVVSLLPTVLVGTQSVYSTLVPIGYQTAIPTYVFQGNTMVVDHYSVFTSPTQIHGWFPQHVVAISPLCIPVFSAVFALASSLDSLHSFVHNHCSLRSAIVNSAKGACAGAAIGALYYGLVTSLGIAHAPLISTGLCVGWLFSLYASHSLSSADLVVGTVANLAGVSAFLLTANPLFAVAAALLGSALGSGLHYYANTSWENYLLFKLEEKAREVLNVDIGCSKREIESAYRHLARECHPDKRNDACSVDFELIHVAKEILLYRVSTPSTSFVSAFFAALTATQRPSRPELPSDYLETPD